MGVKQLTIGYVFYLKRIIKLILIIINPIIWLLKWFIPTKRNLILFQSANYDVYSDNAKYLFEYMSLNSNKNCYWLTRNHLLEQYLWKHNYKFVHHPSLKSIWFFLRCDIIISGETSPPNGNGFLSHYAKAINITHGFGPRSTNSPDGKMYKSANELCKAINKFNVMGFSSVFTKNLIGKQLFQLPEEKSIIMGLPRCDNLLNKKMSIYKKYNKEYCKGRFDNINSQSKVILYAPTWRQNPNNRIPLFNVNGAEISNLNLTLKRNNTFILVSAHILDSFKLPKYDYSNIKLFIPTFDLDIHGLLPEIDILLTDYSSIITDFLLLKRPILFHIPDYDYYFNYGLNIDLKLILPGIEIKDIYDLQNIIRNKLYINSKKKYTTDIYLRMFYDISITNSSQRYLNFINGKS